jgi:hypothetical protein
MGAVIMLGGGNGKDVDEEDDDVVEVFVDDW